MTALGLIHAAKRDLGLSDENYRAELIKVTGKSSSGDMNEAERAAVLARFRELGWKPQAKSGRGPAGRASGKYAPKLQALWIAAWNLGLVRNPDDRAMIAFVKRQTGVEHTRFLTDAAAAYMAIEALKSWIARDGGVFWTEPKGVSNGYRVAAAQWRRLRGLGAVTPGHTWTGRKTDAPEDMVRYAAAIIGRGHCIANAAGERVDEWTSAEWITVMTALGKKLRAALADKRAA